MGAELSEDPAIRAVQKAWAEYEAQPAETENRLRSAQALAQAKWLSWEQRRAAARATLTAKIFHTGEPTELRALLKEVVPAILHDRHTRVTRAMTRGEILGGNATSACGEQAFGRWGPRVLRAIARDAVFEECADGPPDVEEPSAEPRGGRLPSDEWAAQRSGWYSCLADEFTREQTVMDTRGRVTVHAGGREVTDQRGRVLVWTDGSSEVTDKARQAGAGVFYGHANPANKTLTVPGRQTSVRAELFAVLHVLRTERRPVSLRTDCRIVAAGINVWRRRWRARAWFAKHLDGITIPHADLWRELDRRLEARSADFEVSWVKGHPLPRHVREGSTSNVDAWGNTAADVLAEAARKSADPGKRSAAERAAPLAP